MGYILITGSSGFIGTNFLKYIENYHADTQNRIVLLSNSMSSKFITIPHKNYRFIANHFIEKGILNIDSVIHLGAFIPKENSSQNLFNENYSNILNTIYLLANLPSKPKKFILISTVDVYGSTKSVIDENTPLIPATFYGECKWFCEKAVLQYCSLNKIIPQILRLGHIYGPGEQEFIKLIPQTIRTLIKNKNPIVYTKGEEKRSYLHISDCVKAIWKSLDLDEYIGPVNIASSKSYTIKFIVEALLEISGKKLNIEFLNKKIIAHDMIFNNQKMIQYLSDEKSDIIDGLREEFYLFNQQNERKRKKSK